MFHVLYIFWTDTLCFGNVIGKYFDIYLPFLVHFKSSLTFIDAVYPVDEPWQHAQAGHGQDEERRNSRSSYGAQVPCSGEELVND